MKKVKLLGLCLYPIFSILFVTSCNTNNNVGDLYWTDPPTTGDTIFQNPIFEPVLADPTFIRTADENGAKWFYAYGTEDTWAQGIHRITPIIRSKNLVKWEYVADAFTRETKPTWKSEGGLWAPQIYHNSGTGGDGLFYLFYSYSKWADPNPGIGVARSKYPYGPFSDMGKILDTQSSGVGGAIDQFYIKTGAGRNMKSYIFWGSFHGLYGQEIASDMKTLIGSKFQVGGRGFEGIYIYEHGGKYWMFTSSNSCCEGPNTKYFLAVAVADVITGPYRTKAGMDIKDINDFQAASSTKFLVGDGKVWIGPGHNAEIIQDDKGRYFMLYHAVSVAKPWLINEGGATRRPLMMDEVHWGADGWPYIEGGIPSSTKKTAPYFAAE